MSASLDPTPRTQVKRLPTRGHFDRGVVNAILDEGIVCHVGFVHEGSPVVIPTGYGRRGDTLLLHGSAASRMFRTLASGAEICVTVTLVDGLVLAKSAFHHSMNYRSVVIFAKARSLDGPEEKRDALRVFTEHVLPGRWATTRPPNGQELKATLVVALPIEEASAKIRTGPPMDDEEDLSWPVWAGVLPLRVRADDPVPAGGSEAVAEGWTRRSLC